MPRPPKCRDITGEPQARYFRPRGIPLTDLDEVCLTLDELEAIRLVDLRGLQQAKAAPRMNVSRQTVGLILASARRKIADALAHGKALRIAGGPVRLMTQGPQPHKYRKTRKENTMRICIPTATKDGLKATVYGHFGSAPYFTLCDSKTMECEVIDNGNAVHEHGMCNPLKAVGESKPDAVAVGGIGMGAIRGLKAAGIKVYLSGEATVEATVAAIIAGKLKEADASAACGGHGAHGCH
jgi:predicted DNA-binding protein (UPF0251 family)/predicted Fe-Mo cluster-binding NifX family protein